MAFYEYGPGHSDEQELKRFLTTSRERALVLDRVNHMFETWVDGRCVFRGANQIEATKAFENKPDAVSTEERVIYCAKCGQYLSDDDNFCSKCGSPKKPSVLAAGQQSVETDVCYGRALGDWDANPPHAHYWNFDPIQFRSRCERCGWTRPGYHMNL